MTAPVLPRCTSVVIVGGAVIGIRKFFCGPESFTPDLRPIVGEAPELNWIIKGRPDVDVTGFNIDRLHNYQRNPLYHKLRTIESL